MVINTTNKLLGWWYGALLKISYPSGFISQTQQAFRMPGLPASVKQDLNVSHLSDGHVSLIHFRSPIRPNGSSLLILLLFFLTHPAKLLPGLYQRLNNQIQGFSIDNSLVRFNSSFTNSGMIFRNLEFIGRLFSINLLKNSI